MASCSIFFGGRRKTDLPAAISAGRHPRVEYLALLEEYGGRLIDFDEVQAAPFLLVRTVMRRYGMRRFGPHWAMAVLARLRKPEGEVALTTGEDVGLPIALVQRLTAGKLPVAIIVHGSYLASPKMGYALRVLRGLPSVRFLCLSETLRGRLVEQHGIPAERTHNIGYGVDTEFFWPDGGAIAPRPRQIASAGMAKRDYSTLIAATAGTDVCVKIAADSAWFRTEIDIAGQSLPPNVEVRSYGDYVGLRRLYSESAFVVVPLYQAVHACGYAVIAEAMAMGKPVISTRISGHSDFIVDGETGFYVPPGDAAALSERIQYLLERPDLVRAMGHQARKMMVERYSLDAYTARIAAAAGLSPAHSEAADRERPVTLM